MNTMEGVSNQMRKRGLSEKDGMTSLHFTSDLLQKMDPAGIQKNSIMSGGSALNKNLYIGCSSLGFALGHRLSWNCTRHL